MAHSNVVQLYNQAVLERAGAHPAPQVAKQLASRQVEVSNAQSLAIGAWLLCGPEQIGVCRGHRHGRAVVDLAFERDERGRWRQVRTAARAGAVVTPLPGQLWSELFDSMFGASFEVGSVRQESVQASARIASLGGERMIVTGFSGSGKSTAIVASLTAFRQGPAAGPRPAVIVFDAHGDYLGRVRSAGGQPRPNLRQCLPEPPVVLDAGALTCRVRDLPPSLIARALGKLSAAQQRWADRYAIDDEDHSGIEHLIFERHEPQWPALFPDLATNGEMPKTQAESLKTLRCRMRALMAPPLFSTDNQSTWARFFGHVRSGEVIVVDVASYPEPQQTLLIVLVLLAVQRDREAAQRRGEPLPPIVLVADELHRYPGAYERFSKLALEGRKFGIGTILGSQRLAHLPDDVLTQATSAIVLRLEGKDVRAAVDRWPALKCVEHELDRLDPGHGYYIAANVAWPIAFHEPAFVRPGGA